MSNIIQKVRNVTQTQSGLVASAGQLLGTNTNDNPTSGNVGEVITNAFPFGVPSTSIYAGYIDVATITLSAGDFMVSGMLMVFSNTASATYTTILGVESAIQAIAGNDSSQFVNGVNYSTFTVGTIYPTNQSTTITIPPFRVQSDGTNLYFLGFTSSSTQNMNLKGTIQGRTAGNAIISGSLTATRIR